MDKRGKGSRDFGKDDEVEEELLMHMMKGTTLIVLECEEGWLTGSDCRITAMKDGIEKVKTDTWMKSILARHRNHMVMLAGYLMVAQIMAREIRFFICDNGEASLENIWSCIEHKIKEALTAITQIESSIDAEYEGVVLVVDRRRRDQFLEITAIKAKGDEEFTVSKAYKTRTVIGSGEKAVSHLVSRWKCVPYYVGKEAMTNFMERSAFCDSATGGYVTIFVGGPTKEWTWIGAKLLESEATIPCSKKQKVEVKLVESDSQIPDSEREIVQAPESLSDSQIPDSEKEIVQAPESEFVQVPDSKKPDSKKRKPESQEMGPNSIPSSKKQKQPE